MRLATLDSKVKQRIIANMMRTLTFLSQKDIDKVAHSLSVDPFAEHIVASAELRKVAFKLMQPFIVTAFYQHDCEVTICDDVALAAPKVYSHRKLVSRYAIEVRGTVTNFYEEVQMCYSKELDISMLAGDSSDGYTAILIAAGSSVRSTVPIRVLTRGYVRYTSSYNGRIR